MDWSQDTEHSFLPFQFLIYVFVYLLIYLSTPYCISHIIWQILRIYFHNWLEKSMFHR